MTPASPYLSAQKAVEYLELPSMEAFKKFRQRRKAKGMPLPTYRLGGRLRFKVRDLDACVERVGGGA